MHYLQLPTQLKVIWRFWLTQAFVIGLDVVRMLALGADTVLLGRAFVYALAAAGGQGVIELT